MRIKQLILNGFKSFSDKTTITFDRSINAIVGPNGCGKSNILDGLRWVMGEASFSEMRCTKTEDLIFAGNKYVPAVNYAEVVLILELTENDKFVTPALANLNSEIEIRRRYFRSGESEFFINKKPCRLRDIQDLFTSGGGSGKAYSIFDLPTMRRIISDNLKELFIEASGLAFYHERKEEIERKLKQTQDDLIRLRDIIAERMRITRNLKRQAYRLMAFEKVKTEEQKLQIALLRFDYLVVLDEETKIDTELAKLNIELKELKDKFNSAESKKAELKTLLSEREAVQNELIREINSLKEQLIIAEERFKNNLEKQSFYKEELKKIQNELEFFRPFEITPQTIEEKKEYLAQIKELYRKKEEEFEKLRQTNKELEAEIFSIQLQLDELENQEKELYFELTKLNSEIESYEEKLNNNQRYFETLKKSYESIKLTSGEKIVFYNLTEGSIKAIFDYYTDNLVGILTDLIYVPDEYKLAFRSSLWGLETLVVVKDLRDITDFPSNLSQPLLVTTSKPNLSDEELPVPSNLPDVLYGYQRLIDLVTLKGPIPIIIREILENTFVIDDLKKIFELSKKFSQYSFTHPSGITLRKDGVLVVLPSSLEHSASEVE
ncbi:MAG: AAA family ATPase, partial [candidate division WOR-3 bacterium]|nr:AAA family ATPase [candidate division WOR-3 bacterium]